MPLYDNFNVEFEESWRDTVSLLGAPSLRGARERAIADMIAPLEAAIGGKVILDAATGRYYLQVPAEGRLEMPLIAEGLRKLAMLVRLITTGTLLEQGQLYWDEPETNLNPKLIALIARSIMYLARQGIQVFVATRSLFLLRELELLSLSAEFQSVGTRYFGLRATEDGNELEQGDEASDLTTLVLLDEELKQSDRYLYMDTDAGNVEFN